MDEGRAGLAGGGSIADDRVPSDGESEPGGVPRAGLVAGGRGELDDAVVPGGGGAPDDEGPVGIAGTGGDRPGDVARAALRAAVATRRGRGAPPTAAGPAPVTDADGPVVEGDRAEAARPEAGSGREAGAADAAAAGAADTGAEDAGPAGATGGRPGDVAREALRAARREASRAQAADPRPERRTPARSATATPRTSPASGQQTSAARTKAAQDMRHYLATAFRMPTWAETPEEPEEHAPPTPTGPTPPAPASAPPPPASGPSETVPAVRTPALPTEPSASVPSAPSVSGPSAEVSRTTASAPEAQAPAPEPSAHTSARPGPDGPFARWTPAARPTPAQAVPSEPSAHPAPGTSPAPAAPHVPTTMATPHRDTELRRTFPAFAPRESAGGTGPFAGTWWGNAWVGALEQGALDAKRLARGRGYADQGHVDAITVTPGLVLAYVRGSRPRPYRVQVRVRTLEDEDWERFLDAAADWPGHIAALLDKELPQSLADCGVPLLPGPGDLAPRCSCPDSGHPCKHAAALCYQTARLLDADPFVLLLLRGRGERELLDALSRRSAARAARAARERQPQTLPGVRAADALAPRELPPLPRPLPVPPHPEQPPAYPSVPGGPDPFALDQLATDAAARAHALLATGRDPVGELTLWQDAVRLAAARPGSGLTAATRTLYATLAAAARRTPADLARAVAAWRQGGAAGLAALEEPWDPPAGRFDRARPLLLAADLPAFRPWRNRLTHPRGHVQLRLGRDGLWYAYESDPGQDDWWPRGTPDLDPVGALTGLGIPDDAV
ncbi:SWIM zinc finger family protein [Streptomyces olivaceoviridis]|uniref:SWIM zinc finger family protein n=1 Tax=Streptomyces olivaceoviridis TaxID=1921 RepID=UPI00367C2559